VVLRPRDTGCRAGGVGPELTKPEISGQSVRFCPEVYLSPRAGRGRFASGWSKSGEGARPGPGCAKMPPQPAITCFRWLTRRYAVIPYSLLASIPRSGAIFDLSTMPRLKPCLMPSATGHSRLFSCPDGSDTERRTVPSRAIRWAMRGHMEAGQSLASHALMLSGTGPSTMISSACAVSL
jgi:hypothetical protein